MISKKKKKTKRFDTDKVYTGWCRVKRCLKLQVIYRKRATNHGALLWNMIYKDKAFYDSTPPCTDKKKGVETLK